MSLMNGKYLYYVICLPVWASNGEMYNAYMLVDSTQIHTYWCKAQRFQQIEKKKNKKEN